MSKRLGRILMETGMLTIDDLNEALDTQKSTGQKLGEVLLNLSMVTQEELDMALSFQEDDEED